MINSHLLLNNHKGDTKNVVKAYIGPKAQKKLSREKIVAYQHEVKAAKTVAT